MDLAPITGPALVASVIAQALGVWEAGGQPLIDSLKEYLKQRQICLLLDNFEHLTEAAGLVGQLLQVAPGLKALVTSRVPLHIRGEKEFPVPPLTLPDLKHLPRLEHLAQYEAVRLFIERAMDVNPDFQVTNDNAPAVAEICHRLDGLPLAIELAAARVRLLPPQAMLARLQNRLKLLTGGARDLPARQQTLRATIDWSYELLQQGEKQLFRLLAVFAGGRTLEAIEAVCGGGIRSQESGVKTANLTPDSWLLIPLEIDLLDGVESLVAKSLLRREESTTREPRFVMLETIHEFAREKLEESGEAEELRRQHALHFMKLAEEAEPEVRGPRQVEWLERLEKDHDNFRAALTWVRKEDVEGVEGKIEEPQPVDIGLRIVGALHRFWMHRGHFTEGRQQIRSILNLDAAKGGTAARRAMWLCSVMRVVRQKEDAHGAAEQM